ncbi:MAG: hypothetical protein ACI9IJ_002328 [Psychromonas sp.]
MSIASYCSIKRLAIIIFSCAILDHLLMRIGIIPNPLIFCSSMKVKIDALINPPLFILLKTAF